MSKVGKNKRCNRKATVPTMVQRVVASCSPVWQMSCRKNLGENTRFSIAILNMYPFALSYAVMGSLQAQCVVTPCIGALPNAHTPNLFKHACLTPGAGSSSQQESLT